jgi:hypothetical protein
MDATIVPSSHAGIRRQAWKGSPMSLHPVLLAPTLVDIAAAAEDPGSGRLGSVVAVLLGIASVAAGWLALAQARRRVAHNGLNAALTSLLLGLTGVVVSAVLLSDSGGDVGTGNGRGGSIVALAVGVVGIGVGGLATTRSRRVARSAA